MSFFSPSKSKQKVFDADRHRNLRSRAEALSQLDRPVQETADYTQGLNRAIRTLTDSNVATTGRDLLEGRTGSADVASRAARAYATDPTRFAEGGRSATAAQLGEVDLGAVERLTDNPVLNAQIDAALRDVQRNLGESTLPNIGLQFSRGVGGAGSSRRGVAEAIAARGARDRAADVAAGLRGDAYARALGIQTGREEADVGRQQQAETLTTEQLNRLYGLGGQLRETGLARQEGAGDTELRRLLGGTELIERGAQQQVQGGLLERQKRQDELDEQYRREMTPYQQAEWLARILGDPTILSEQRGAGLGYRIAEAGAQAAGSAIAGG